MLQKNSLNIFLIFIVFHLSIWTLIPSLSNINLPLDTIEHLAWSTNISLGYSKHPPMIAVVLNFFYNFFKSNDWAYYFLSQLFIVISFIYVWMLSQEILKDKVLSLLSVLILEAIVFHNYTTPEFNVYICQLPFKVLTVYYCWKSLTRNKIYDWFLFGLFAALGFLTHYSFIFIILSVKIFFIIKIFKDKKFYLRYLIPGTIFLLMISPHVMWLFENNFSTITYALQRSGLENKSYLDHLINPFIFLLKQIGILLPAVFLIYLVVNKMNFKINLKDKKLLFLIFINLIPIFLVFLTSFLTGAKIRTMWMSTFYLFFGTFLFYIFAKKIDKYRLKKFLYCLTFIFLLSPISYLYISLSNDFKRTDYQGKEISRLVQNKWNKNFSNNIDVVIGDAWYAGNLSYHLNSRPKWFETLEDNLENINETAGFIYTGNPKVLKDICPGVFGVIKPVGYCMIGTK